MSEGRTSPFIGFMCKTDFDYDMRGAHDGARIYPSEKALAAGSNSSIKPSKTIRPRHLFPCGYLDRMRRSCPAQGGASMTFADFISRKGVEKLSVVLNTPPNTIYSWTYRNCIPRKEWPSVLVAIPELGLRDLFDMETASMAARQERV